MSAAGGLDGMVSSAIRGKAAMPPKGGDPSLSDEEVRAAVEYMLEQTGV
jgi:cytochrome c5